MGSETNFPTLRARIHDLMPGNSSLTPFIFAFI
jgi:hypothetical protein